MLKNALNTQLAPVADFFSRLTVWVHSYKCARRENNVWA